MNFYVKIIFATSISLSLIGGHSNKLAVLGEPVQKTIEIVLSTIKINSSQNVPEQTLAESQEAIVQNAEIYMQDYFKSNQCMLEVDKGTIREPIFVGCKLERISENINEYSTWAKKNKLMIKYDLYNPGPVVERLLCPRNYKSIKELFTQALAEEPLFEKDEKNVSQILECIIHQNIGLIKTLEDAQEILKRQLVNHPREIIYNKKHILKTHCTLKTLSACANIKYKLDQKNFILSKDLFKLTFGQIEINNNYSYLSMFINYRDNSNKIKITTSVLTLEEDLKKILLGQIKAVPQIEKT